MKLDVKFSETNQLFDLEFDNYQTASSGGYDEGYTKGYEKGEADGYNKGHADGAEQGYATGYTDGEKAKEKLAESIVDRSITEYSNNEIKSIGDRAFYACGALKYVNCPEVTSIGEYAFQNCSTLEEATMPKATTMKTGVFQGCKALHTVDFPNYSERLNGYAFQNCASLVNVNLPKLTLIGNHCFTGCSSLEKLDFPCITAFETAFQKCTALKTFIVRTNAVCSYKSANAFDDTPIANGTGYIYVPDDLVEEYKSATNWSNYAAQIKPLSELGE